MKKEDGILLWPYPWIRTVKLLPWIYLYAVFIAMVPNIPLHKNNHFLGTIPTKIAKPWIYLNADWHPQGRGVAYQDVQGSAEKS